MRKILAGTAVALGLAASVPTTVNTTSEVSNKTIETNKVEQTKNTNQQDSKNPFSSETRMKISAREVDKISTYRNIGYNVGIPPKTYGMYYVKKGTHKRNNI